MPRFTGFHHLALATGDMDRTIRFWRDLIGLPLAAGLGRPGARQYFFELAPGCLLGFFEWPGVEPIPEKDHGYPTVGPFAYDHVALGVESQDGLWEIKDRLEAAGFWVSEPMDHGFIHSIYAFDPNGVAIEFAHRAGPWDPHQQPRMVDRQPSEVAREGAAPRPGHWPLVSQPTPAQERRVYPGEGRDLLEKEPWRG